MESRPNNSELPISFKFWRWLGVLSGEESQYIEPILNGGQSYQIFSPVEEFQATPETASQGTCWLKYSIFMPRTSDSFRHSKKMLLIIWGVLRVLWLSLLPGGDKYKLQTGFQLNHREQRAIEYITWIQILVGIEKSIDYKRSITRYVGNTSLLPVYLITRKDVASQCVFILSVRNWLFICKFLLTGFIFITPTPTHSIS